VQRTITAKTWNTTRDEEMIYMLRRGARIAFFISVLCLGSSMFSMSLDYPFGFL